MQAKYVRTVPVQCFWLLSLWRWVPYVSLSRGYYMNAQKHTAIIYTYIDIYTLIVVIVHTDIRVDKYYIYKGTYIYLVPLFTRVIGFFSLLFYTIQC